MFVSSTSWMFQMFQLPTAASQENISYSQSSVTFYKSYHHKLSYLLRVLLTVFSHLQLIPCPSAVTVITMWLQICRIGKRAPNSSKPIFSFSFSYVKMFVIYLIKSTEWNLLWSYCQQGSWYSLLSKQDNYNHKYFHNAASTEMRKSLDR